METYLPAHAEAAQTVLLLIRRFREEMAVNHRVQQPVPVLLRYVRHEPRVPLAMEANFLGEPALNEEVG